MKVLRRCHAVAQKWHKGPTMWVLRAFVRPHEVAHLQFPQATPHGARNSDS